MLSDTYDCVDACIYTHAHTHTYVASFLGKKATVFLNLQ